MFLHSETDLALDLTYFTFGQTVKTQLRSTFQESELFQEEMLL